MAKFEIPASPKYSYLDLNDLKGLDTMSTSPNYMRASDMLNLVKKDGVHRIRSSVFQSYRVHDKPVQYIDTDGKEKFNDLDFDLKFFGKVEEIENGNTVPYYIKISEKLGPVGMKNGSTLAISLHTEPYLQYDFDKFKDFKVFKFTNYGDTGNRNNLYESIDFDGKTWVFTPIGILTFKCSRTMYDVVNKEYLYNFEVINVLDDPYIPLIGIGSNPDGTGFTKYESLNLLSDTRIVRFKGDGTSTSYVLPENNILPNDVKVKVLNDSGAWDDSNVEFTVNTTGGTIDFTSALPKGDSQDNIEIWYHKDEADYDKFEWYYGSYDEDKVDLVIKWKNLGENPEQPGYYTVQFDITCKPGKEFVEGKDFIEQINYQVFKGEHQVFGFMIEPFDMYNKDEVYHTVQQANVSKIFYDDDSLKWEIGYALDLITHDNVVTSVLGDTGKVSNVQTEWNISSKAIDENGNDIPWMGVFVGSQSYAMLNHYRGDSAKINVFASGALILSDKSDLICPNAKMKVMIGTEWYDVADLNIDGSKDAYPSDNMLSGYSMEIPYSEELGGTKLPIKWRIELNTFSEKEGRHIQYVDSETIELELPKVTFPLSAEELASYTNHTTIKTPAGYEIYDVSNILDLHRSKLSCYYFTKCCTVYGYEADRRVFVTDGTGTDTFSGYCADGKSSIYYFPDDNYRVLGEDTEILGYAETEGKLLTFKRGDDSVYVRYGTTLAGTVQFPSLVVTKNLQIFAKPIQIGNEILVITRDGIKSIVYTENEVRAHLRSYFINSYFPLWKDYEYDRMQWYVEENMLHIFLDKFEFVADLNAKSYVAEGNTPGRNAGTSTLQFQYDWYVCKHNEMFEIPRVVVYQPRDFEQAELVDMPQDLVPIGYSNKAFYRFEWNGPKVDGFMDKTQNHQHFAIPAKFVTPFLNFGSINLAKTIKYVYINTRAIQGSAYEVGYIDENGYTETMEKIYEEINDQLTRYRNTVVPFPKLIQIKSKIKKFMNIKLYIKNLVEDDGKPIKQSDVNKYRDMNFDRILIQYQASGKYRGE